MIVATIIFSFFIQNENYDSVEEDETQFIGKEESLVYETIETTEITTELDQETLETTKEDTTYPVIQEEVFIPHEYFIKSNGELITIGESYYSGARPLTTEEHKLIYSYCQKWEVDYDLMLALFYVETGCNIDRDPYDGQNPKWKTAYYGAGSVGATWGKWCKDEFGLDITDKYQALEASCAIIKTYIDERAKYWDDYNQCVIRALARYNTGSYPELTENGKKYANYVLYIQNLIKEYYREK